MEQFDYGILGRTRFRVGDRLSHDWGEPKLRAMLAVLLLHSGRAVSVEELADWIWPEHKAPENLQTTFYTYSTRVRNALERMAHPPQLRNTGGAYLIDADREKIDFFIFREAVEQARSKLHDGDSDGAVRQLSAALETWVDEPCSDLQGERARRWRLSARDDIWIPAVDILANALIQQDRHGEVLRRLADLPAELHTNLTLVKRRLEALYGMHRGQEATAIFLGVRRRLILDFDQYEADELTRFHHDLQQRMSQPVTRPTELAGRARPIRADPPLLRHDIPDFVGRTELLDELDRQLITSGHRAPTGIFVLHGAPGAGKTTLAVHWAHRIAARFADTAIYLELNGYIDGPKVEPQAAVDELLAKLGFPAERIPTPAGRAAKLRNLLSGRRAIVLLDNARDSVHVRPLLDSLVPALVIVTSRRTLTGLRSRGAVHVQVGPLELSDARTWLARRIRERAEADPQAVEELATLCNGIPLALRVVAEHVVARPHLRLFEFVDELRDIPVLLGLGDDGDGPDGSVRAAFSCSYRELRPDERRVFRLLGLHPGPDISLEAAAALFGDGIPYAKRNLDVLVTAHLVTQPETRGRYRAHDLLRAYAAECIGADAHADERRAAEARMLNFYLHTANSADRAVFPYQSGVELPPLIDGVTPVEFADDRAAMDWCIRERTNLNAIIAYAWARRLHEYASTIPSAAGEVFIRFRYFDDVVVALEIACQSAQATGDREGEADALGNLGTVHVIRGDFASAETCLAKAMDRADSINYELGRAQVMHQLARLYLERGDSARAITSHLEALKILRQHEVRGAEINVLCRLAQAYRHSGDLGAAHSLAGDALWRAEQLGSQHTEGLCLNELGAIYLQQGDTHRAKATLSRALVMLERVRDLATAGKVCVDLATILHNEGSLAAAESHAGKAVEHCQKVFDHRSAAEAYDLLGRIQTDDGRPDDAAVAWMAALAIYDDLADERAAATIRSRLARPPGA